MLDSFKNFFDDIYSIFDMLFLSLIHFLISLFYFVSIIAIIISFIIIKLSEFTKFLSNMNINFFPLICIFIIINIFGLLLILYYL